MVIYPVPECVIIGIDIFVVEKFWTCSLVGRLSTTVVRKSKWKPLLKVYLKNRTVSVGNNRSEPPWWLYHAPTWFTSLDPPRPYDAEECRLLKTETSGIPNCSHHTRHSIFARAHGHCLWNVTFISFYPSHKWGSETIYIYGLVRELWILFLLSKHSLYGYLRNIIWAHYIDGTISGTSLQPKQMSNYIRGLGRCMWYNRRLSAQNLRDPTHVWGVDWAYGSKWQSLKVRGKLLPLTTTTTMRTTPYHLLKVAYSTLRNLLLKPITIWHKRLLALNRAWGTSR